MWVFWKCLEFFSFSYMRFIVKLVSIQHPVLIPKDALFNNHHPPSPPSHPHQPSVCSQFLRVSYALALSHSNLSLGFSFLKMPFWVAQLVKHLTLDFGSGHDLTVRGLWADSEEPAWDSLALFLPLPSHV